MPSRRPSTDQAQQLELPFSTSEHGSSFDIPFSPANVGPLFRVKVLARTAMYRQEQLEAALSEDCSGPLGSG